ncbi:MAG: tetratricopeptide repeat protein [Myxococcales bacterium]|nr:tetratricopeptide repeat protein [Myxococcales bacterium]
MLRLTLISALLIPLTAHAQSAAPAPDSAPEPVPAPVPDSVPAPVPDSAPASDTDSAAVGDLVATGIAHYNAGNHDNAIAVFEQALAVRPGDASLLGWRGMAELAAGRVDKAVATLRRAAVLEPSVADHQVRLGRAHEASGDVGAARLAYTRALRIAPQHPEARQALAALSGRRANDPERPRPPAEPVERSYAAWLISAYVAAPLLFGALVAATDSEIAVIGFLAPSAVHFGFEQPVRGLIAPLGMTGLTLVGAYGIGFASNCDGLDCIGAVVLGGLVGYVSWAVIDVAFFSSYTEAAPRPAESGQLQLSPMVSPRAAGLHLSWRN